MYLIDTNIFLELLLEQEKADDVRKFLNKVNPEKVFFTDFTLHSIGVILFKLNKREAFICFVKDTIIASGVKVLSVLPEETIKLPEISKQYGLSFDDTYQYFIAQKYNLKIVSFDADFNKTERKKILPEQI